MHKIFRDFVSNENRDYPLHLGKTVASSLTGFIMGVIATNIVWTTTMKYIFVILGY
jgi:hypothetical protein